MSESETQAPEPLTPQVQEFWRRKGLQARRVLNALRSRLGHKMTPKSRSKLQLEILKTERAIKKYRDYETGAKIPPQPKEQEEMNETPRIIEIAYGPEPWRLAVNVMAIQSLQFLPKFGKKEDGSPVYEAFVVTVNVAGRLHEFPFNRAIDAQSLYEYIKSELATVGLTIRTLEPTPIQPAPTPPSANKPDPRHAANDEIPQTMGPDAESLDDDDWPAVEPAETVTADPDDDAA